MGEGLLVYYASFRERQAARERLTLAERWAKLEHSHISIGPSLHQLRREADLATWRWRRNAMWVRRWVRLLLGVRAHHGSVYVWGTRGIPNFLEQWKAYLPHQVTYHTTTGVVELEPGGIKEAMDEERRLALHG
jgi:hypothetical protein